VCRNIADILPSWRYYPADIPAVPPLISTVVSAVISRFSAGRVPTSRTSARPKTCLAMNSMTGDFERAGLFRYERSDLFNTDPAEADKRQRANELLRRDDGALSIQVLQEFYTRATRPTRPRRLPMR
jgi:hypothetical protein